MDKKMDFQESVKNEVEKFLSSTPTGRKVLEDNEAKRRQIRAAAEMEIDRINQREFKEIPVLERAVSKALERVHKAQKELAAANGEHLAAQTKVSALAIELHRQRKQQQRILRETEPDCLHRFILEMDLVPSQLINGMGHLIYKGDIARRLSVVQAAKKLAEDMLKLDLSSAEAEAELSKIREEVLTL